MLAHDTTASAPGAAPSSPSGKGDAPPSYSDAAAAPDLSAAEKKKMLSALSNTPFDRYRKRAYVSKGSSEDLMKKIHKDRERRTEQLERGLLRPREAMKQRARGGVRTSKYLFGADLGQSVIY